VGLVAVICWLLELGRPREGRAAGGRLWCAATGLCFFLQREVSGRERPGWGLLLPLPPLRERLSLAGVGDAAAEAGFCG